MHTVIWEFVVRPGLEQEFERVYGRDGDWAALFRLGDGFLSTELVSGLGGSDGQRYLTIDRWRSADHLSRFMAAFADAYADLDRRCEALTVRERRLAAFDDAPAPGGSEPGSKRGRDHGAGAAAPEPGDDSSSIIAIRPATQGDIPAWKAMRHDLWPDCAEEIHAHECALLLRHPDAGAVMVASDPTGTPVGFIECSVRRYAEGCHGGRVGYIEGWYVVPARRRKRIGLALMRAAEAWARAVGCLEMASDTELDNTVSQAGHRRGGYHEAGRQVHYRKPLDGAFT